MGKRAPSQVVLREGRLYTVRKRQVVACLDAVTGELIWEKAHPVGEYPILELDNGVLRFSGFSYGGEDESSYDPLNRDKKELVHWYKEIDPAKG